MKKIDRTQLAGSKVTGGAGGGKGNMSVLQMYNVNSVIYINKK